MQRLSKRRGVISVFLLIIFMVTYVFMGLLVDAARYRMAETYLESALDQAGNSVLANYNRLLFDLYGLFSVETGAEDEAAMEAKIKEMYNHYLDETLGIADVDAKEYETVLNTIFAGIKGGEEPNASTKQLYDFKIENLNAGSVVTLADSANVESQIIEYMKFRAPVDLIGEMSGFLEKIKGLLAVKDRVQDAIEKTEITKRYENGGEDSLSSQAYSLQSDINKFAVMLYNYSVDPTKEISSFGAADPGKMMDRNAVYGKNPFSLKILIQRFDERMCEAAKEYEDALQNMENRYAEKLFELLNTFRSKLKNDNKEVVVAGNYKNEDGSGQTNNFSEIDFHKDELNVPVTIGLSEDLYQALLQKAETDRTEYEKTYIENFTKEKEKYINGGRQKEIEDGLQKAHSEAREELLTALENIEANAGFLYQEAVELRDRLDTVIRRYKSYIGELQAKLDQGGESKKTVYAPEIELARGNAGELLKNLDLLLNSRPYLNNIGYGYASKGLLSVWLGGQADDVISKREDYYIDEKEPVKKEIYLSEEPLKGMVGLGEESYKDGNASKDLYLNPYTEAVGSLVPQEQGDLCVLYSHASYFQTCHYQKDVDVDTGKSVSENEINTDSVAQKNVQEEKKEESAAGKALDNEEMLKDADYLKYLTVNYQHSEPVIEDDANSEASVSGKADLDSMLNILNIGQQLIEKLEDLLEGARDNLYIDVYIMSMLPNYYDYLRMNAGKSADELPAAFAKEYEKYTASYASVEYIITGAGAGGGQVFGDGVKAGEGGSLGTGFGEISVEKIRTKLFGTRMLFNCISMFTDSAKYSQASSLSAWAGPFAPLVTIVLMVAWAAAESVLDVLVLLGEGIGPKLNADGQVALLKQGKDWFFSVEGAVSAVANGIIDEIAEGAKKDVSNLTKTLETKINGMIYDAYISAKGTVDQVLSETKENWTNGVCAWTQELEKNMKDGEEGAAVSGNGAAQQTVDSLSNSVIQESGQAFDKVQQGADKLLGKANEQAAVAVSRAGETVVEKANSVIDGASETAKEFLKNNLNKVIPVGEVVKSGKSNLTMGYKEYLYFYLFFMNNEMKVKRIQSVLQANLWVGGRKDFRMETAPASVWADLECTTKYFFLSNQLVPESLRKDGRLRLKVISGQSY